MKGLNANRCTHQDEVLEILAEFINEVLPDADYIALVRHNGRGLVCVNDTTVAFAMKKQSNNTNSVRVH